MSRVIYLRVDDELADAVSAAAANELRSVNAFVTDLLEQHLREAK